MTHPKHYDKEYEVLEMVKIKFLEVNAVIVLIVMEKLLFMMVEKIFSECREIEINVITSGLFRLVLMARSFIRTEYMNFLFKSRSVVSRSTGRARI